MLLKFKTPLPPSPGGLCRFCGQCRLFVGDRGKKTLFFLQKCYSFLLKPYYTIKGRNPLPPPSGLLNYNLHFEQKIISRKPNNLLEQNKNSFINLSCVFGSSSGTTRKNFYDLKLTPNK